VVGWGRGLCKIFYFAEPQSFFVIIGEGRQALGEGFMPWEKIY